MIRASRAKRAPRRSHPSFHPVASLVVAPTATGSMLRLCACGARAVIILVGADHREATTINDAGLSSAPLPAVEEHPDTNLCLPCARATGWPWMTSERVNKGTAAAVRGEKHGTTASAWCADGVAESHR